MPIYCYKCPECGKVMESFCQTYDPPRHVPHGCEVVQRIVSAARHLPAELPAAHTTNGVHFTPHYDHGAGRQFDNQEQYQAWQKANTDADGVAPEPIQGRRKVAMLEEAQQRAYRKEMPASNPKEWRKALGKAFDDAHADLSKCAAMGIKPPSDAA